MIPFAEELFPSQLEKNIACLPYAVKDRASVIASLNSVEWNICVRK